MSVDPAVQDEATAKATKDEARKDEAKKEKATADKAGTAPAATDDAPPKRGRPRKEAGGARKTRSVELVLTVTGTADGEWQADLKHGTQRVVQGVRIPASAVSRAAKELHDEISDGIEQVIGAAREQHRSRLEELEAEMAKVKQALAELDE